MAKSQGHLMLAATDLLRPGPARVGSLGRVTLPRTVRLRSLVAWVTGGATGLAIGAAGAAVVGGFVPLAVGLFAGAGMGHLVVNVEPIPGETLLTYLSLASGGHRNRVALNGTRTRIVVRRSSEGPPMGSPPVEVARTTSLVAYAVPVTRRLQTGAQAFIGICPLETVAAGRVCIVSGMVAVSPGSVDERGVPHHRKAVRSSTPHHPLQARAFRPPPIGRRGRRLQPR